MSTRLRSLLEAFVIAFALAGLAIAAKELLAARAAQPPAASPSGIWTGLVTDLPSGRAVECVFARDPNGAVAVTCDWNTAH